MSISLGTEDGSRPETTLQQRLIGLLDYIEHVEKLNRTPAFTVPTDFFCRFEGDLRHCPGLEFNQTEDVWLRIPRFSETDPPAPPDSLRPWVALSKDPAHRPVLREEILKPGEHGQPGTHLRKEDFPHLESSFSVYASGAWIEWAAFEAPRRQTIQLYGALYLLLQALEAEGAENPLELVWGLGVAVWKHPSGHLLRYPIITQLVEIALDAKTLALEIRPRERLPVLEMDAYAELDVPGVVHVESAWRGFVERVDSTLSPFEVGEVESVLKASVGFLDASGIYWPDARAEPDRSVPPAQDHLIVTNTWVIFARKRSPNFLIADLAKLRSSLEQIATIPAGPACLVSELANELVEKVRTFFRGFAYAGARIPTDVTPQNLYFPKAYNDEQVSIIEKLENSAGVVVQGPPGTGKTHTIANVICHYLALGKQVLVTSKGEPALAVLREQIPESVRALSVALLTDEKDGMRQFEHAIQEIAAKVSAIHPDELDAKIQRLEDRVTQLHSQLSAIDTDISRWAEKHLQPVTFSEREMLPAELARFIADGEPIHEWFPDPLQGDFASPQFTESDIDQVRKARRSIGAALHYVGANLPDPNTLPSAAVVGRAHEELRRSHAIDQHLAKSAAGSMISQSPEVLASAAQLDHELTTALDTFDRVHERGLNSTVPLHRAYVGGRVPLLETLDAALKDGQQLERHGQEFLRRPVVLPADADLDGSFCEAVTRLQEGKSAVAFLSLGKGTLRVQLAAVRVAALPPRDKEDWAHVRLGVAFKRAARAFIARWNAIAAEAGLPETSSGLEESFRAVLRDVQHVTALRQLALTHRLRIEELYKQIFGSRLADSNITGTRSSIADLRQIVRYHITRARLEHSRAVVSDGMQKLRAFSGAVVTEMHEFLSTKVGTGLDPAEVARQWARFLDELRRLIDLQPAMAEVSRVSNAVRDSGAVNWAEALRTHVEVGTSDSFTPPNWREAWNWRQAATFLDAIDGRDALRVLQTRRRSTEADLAHAYEELVEHKTWVEVFRNSPPAVKSALQAYLVAIRKIGKGTGVRAARFRKEARDAMAQAYRAVPCWIMPEWRVSETLPAEIGKFDLVIIDEASQSDLWALPALLRGKKLLVVGDDKQVSPDGIGLAEERIKDLKNRFLRVQIHGDQLTPEKSLYDLAKVVFAGEMVMLREHFRCVAPIIEFSKRQFYNHEIRPLRIPRASERLDPPLIDVFVRGGVRSGATNKINEAEAKGIVKEIKAVIKDPICKGRTIGVVSLLGSEQAHRIFDLIRREIPAEEIVARKMTVGDARTFQGKERDIMFLSMVATREEKTTATMQTYEQRFNVAASRARDRMYLYRSVELSDLNKVDLKALLIEHFRTPFHEDPTRTRFLRDLCESDFERAMFDALTQKGYRVQPQVKVGGYRIDLVVDGNEDRRLAVECDGDKYHGPGQWTHDMARQRILERAGWTFWRCFGSSFSRKTQAVLDDLYSTLEKMGIEPIGATSVDPGRYTEHREISPFEKEAEPGNLEASRKPASSGPRAAVMEASQEGTREELQKGIRPAATSASVASTRTGARERSAETESKVKASENRASLATEGLARFLRQHALTWEDNRSRGGALWVYCGDKHPVARQLQAWRFEYKEGRGWWKK